MTVTHSLTAAFSVFLSLSSCVLFPFFFPSLQPKGERERERKRKAFQVLVQNRDSSTFTDNMKSYVDRLTIFADFRTRVQIEWESTKKKDEGRKKSNVCLCIVLQLQCLYMYDRARDQMMMVMFPREGNKRW